MITVHNVLLNVNNVEVEVGLDSRQVPRKAFRHLSRMRAYLNFAVIKGNNKAQAKMLFCVYTKFNIVSSS